MNFATEVQSVARSSFLLELPRKLQLTRLRIVLHPILICLAGKEEVGVDPPALAVESGKRAADERAFELIELDESSAILRAAENFPGQRFGPLHLFLQSPERSHCFPYQVEQDAE